MEPYYQDDYVTLYHGDCRKVLSWLPVADLLFTDPPYGIGRGAAFWRRNGTAIEEHGDSSFNEMVDGWRELVLLRDDGGYWAEWCGSARALPYDQFPSGVIPWREFVWYKPAPAPTPRPTFMSSYEIAGIGYTGKRRWFGGQVPDAWSGLSPNRLGVGEHPSEKPSAPVLRLVGALSLPLELVLDPFAGSGTTLRAAKDLGRRAIGIEIEERYCEIAARRLSQEVLDFGAATVHANG